MTRKTIIWIVAGVFAAAVLAAVGIVAYHVGFDHSGGRGVAYLRGPLRGYRFGAGLGRRDVAFPFLGSFVALLIGGALGAAIVYLTRAGRRPVAATAGQAAAPDTGWPVDPRWQQFAEWHRHAHGVAAPAVPAPAADPGSATTPATPPGPEPDAPDAAAPTTAPEV